MFFFSSRRRHTRSDRDWSSDVCSSDLRSMVLLGSALVGRFAGKVDLAKLGEAAESSDSAPLTLRTVAERLFKSLGRTAVQTLPFIFLGVLLSTVLLDYADVAALASPGSHLLAVGLV